jgi:SAM-dependent methyltransferase
MNDDLGSAGAFSAATGRNLENPSGTDQRRYRAFQLSLIEPHCGPSVLEVGAGLGEFAAQLTGLDRHVVTDVDPHAVAAMAARFADRPEVEARVLNLAGGPIDIGTPVSTVVAINVLEHIDDDIGALEALANITEPDGRIVLWVPAYMQLYGDFDRAVGHVRRYTPATMTSAIRSAGLRPTLVKPVNLLGAVAWWLTVRRGGIGAPNPALVRTYDRFVVPVTRAVERRVTPPFGQTVLAVCER